MPLFSQEKPLGSLPFLFPSSFFSSPSFLLPFLLLFPSPSPGQILKLIHQHLKKARTFGTPLRSPSLATRDEQSGLCGVRAGAGGGGSVGRAGGVDGVGGRVRAAGAGAWRGRGRAAGPGPVCGQHSACSAGGQHGCGRASAGQGSMYAGGPRGRGALPRSREPCRPA